MLGLGAVLVTLMLVVEVLIFDAYANVNRTTAIFGEQSFLNSSLVNAQREAVLLEDQVEELPTTLRPEGGHCPARPARQPALPARGAGR